MGEALSITDHLGLSLASHHLKAGPSSAVPNVSLFNGIKPPKQTNLRATSSGQPGQKLAIDLCRPFPSSNVYKYILTVIYLFNKFAVCVPLRLLQHWLTMYF